MRIQAWSEGLRVGVWLLILTGGMLTGGFATADDDVLFETSFDGSLEGWRLEPPEAFSVVESGDDEHRGVLEMRPHGAQTHALLPGSKQWQSYRIEGEVLFPPTPEGSSPHNYLGFIYHLQQREDGRIDLGSVYIKGNGSYVRANPRRDWNPARMLYEEYRTALTGDDAIVIGEWQRFAVEVAGPDFHLYVGDLDVPKVTFDLYEGTSGAAGFKPRVVGGPVWLDNLRVTEISSLRYQGPRLPEGIDYHPERLVTGWEVLGPLTRAYPEIERDPGAEQTVVDGDRELSWRRFETDARGAVVTARVVDFVSPRSVAYFRTRVTTSTRAHFEISSIDDTAIWVDDRFVGYGYAARFAWHDFGDNPEHATDDRITLEPGTHTVVVRVRGGRYAAGGFFARVVEDPPVAAADASDWPHWSGPNLDLTSSPGGDVFAGEFRLERLWSTPLGSGYSSVVVVDGRVVAAFSDGTSDFFAAFDAATGAELWRYRIAETYEGHDQNEDGPRSIPTIHDGVVYGLGPWGHLVALRLTDGQKVWSRHVVEDLGAKAPFAGFATAPAVIGDVLVVQTGGPDGHSVSGLDPATGELSWSAEDDFVMYQSPVAVRVDGEDLVFAVTNERVIGLRPRDGEVLWQLPHGLSEDEYHGISQPVLVDSANVLVNGMTETALFRVAGAGDGYRVTEVWRSRALGRGYSPSVPYQGHIYGYGGRFLTCVDAESGEIVWRSRPPGEGVLILVDGDLVILLRTGEVVVAEATPEGFREKARAPGLEYGFLTRPSFAAGRIFVRNLHHLASLSTSAGEAAAALDEPELLGTVGELVRALRTAEDKDRVIDEFVADQSELPIIEGDLVHFVYRGEVEELGIGGSLFPSETPMHRLEGTDLYFRSVTVEPGARYEYYYSVFGEIRPDPLNPRRSTVWGPEISVVTSRGWQEPAHLREPEGPRGRIETLTWESELLGYGREVQVYLPPGYDEAAARYGLLVVHTGDQALTHGLMNRTLDNLIGKTVAPLVVAFVPQVQFGEGNSEIAEYSRALAEELVPLLEESYRTLGRPEARGVMGAGDGAVISIYAVFERPGLFGKVATQSLFMLDLKDDVPVLIENSAQQDLDLYIEWSRLDFKDEPRRDAKAESQEIVKVLEKKGYRPVTLEVADGTGWGGWRLRTDRILETLFPLERTP